MNERPVVELSPGEVLVASVVAANRQAANRERGITNMQGGAQAFMTSEMVGAFGELAVARYLNAYPDLTMHIRSGGGDMKLGKWTVDVKTTRQSSPTHLRIDKKRSGNSDIYVLASANWTEVKLWGYAIARMDCLLEFETVENSGWTSWSIPVERLRPMDRLHAWRQARA